MPINNIIQPGISIVEKSDVTATSKETYQQLVGDGSFTGGTSSGGTGWITVDIGIQATMALALWALGSTR